MNRKTMNMSSTKENNGKAARRLLLRKISIILGVFACFILIVSLGKSHDNNNSNNNNNNRWSSLRRTTRSSSSSSSSSLSSSSDKWVSPTGGDIMKDILNAHLNLVDIHIDINEIVAANDHDNDHDMYAGVYGIFCRVNWAVHKQDPSSVPMFRDVIAHSPHCTDPIDTIHGKRIDIRNLAREARKIDKAVSVSSSSSSTGGVPKALEVGAVVFHESRCGSTLVANLLASMYPAQHRVYSESPPPLATLRNVCGEDYERCSLHTAATVLQDVLYLMSRTDDPMEERVYFKIQSAGSRNIPVFTTAFPTTPWMFIYREPVQVLMSQLDGGRNLKTANCLRQQSSSSSSHSRGSAIQSVIDKYHHHDHDHHDHQLGPEEFCAAHLASITERAAEALNEYAIPINYAQLPDILYHNHDNNNNNLLSLQVTDQALARMKATAGQYSKGRGNRAGAFVEDSQKKEEQASTAMREAAQLFMQPSYQTLEQKAASIALN